MECDTIFSLIQIFFTVIGTIIVSCIQIISAKKAKVTEQRRKIYLDCYLEIDRLIADPELVFDNNYFQILKLKKAEMKLSGSNKVVTKYKEFYSFVSNYLKDYLTLLSQDPRENPNNIRTINDDTGDKHEVNMTTEDDITAFESCVEEYRESHRPSQEEIREYLFPLLNAMRVDLNNKKLSL